MSEVCAGCGIMIESRHGGWAQNTPSGWIYTCRIRHRHGKLISADYHYIVGEEQVHKVWE